MKATVENTGTLATVATARIHSAAVIGEIARVWRGVIDDVRGAELHIMLAVPNDTPDTQLQALDQLFYRCAHAATNEPTVNEHLLATVQALRHEGYNMAGALKLLIKAWAEVCECGRPYDLHDSLGAHLCTACATPDEVRDFMDVEEPHA